MTDHQFTQLNKQMSDLNDHVLKLDQKTTDLTDHFLKLYQHMEERVESVNTSFDRVGERFDRIDSVLDSILKKLETDEQERIFMAHQIDRQAGWIGQLAENTNTKLAPEQ